MPSTANVVGMDFGHTSGRSRRFSGGEIRRLIELRDLIKVESLGLPLALQRELLTILERARPRGSEAPLLPEMSRGELIRAIRWRLGTIPLPGAIAAADYITLHRQRSRRRQSAISPSARQSDNPRQKASKALPRGKGSWAP